MFSELTALLQLAFALGSVRADHAANVRAAVPTVTLDNATVIGYTNNSVTSYMGIPFAHPPIADLRLRLPKPIDSYNGTINATQPATQCIQLNPAVRTDMPAEMLQATEAYIGAIGSSSDIPQGEDCLSVNVQIPEGTQPGAKLPVLVMSSYPFYYVVDVMPSGSASLTTYIYGQYIFGGGFTIGSTAQLTGDVVVQRSIELNQPVIFAALNYRLGPFGFLGGEEVKKEGVGNLGLHDQREALRWIHKHIGAFGGDPNKVTLWGPSAGAISSALQMVTNNGDTEGLFRGAIMDAGSPVPTGDITELQPYYDIVVEHAGCANATDTLDCLRQTPADTLLAAAANVPSLFEYQGLASPWAPRADGVFLTAPPQHLVLAGSVANIPFITGDALDEGTVFATGAWNVTTEDDFRDYVHQYYFSKAPKAVLEPIFKLYPNDPAQGSPFGTGTANQLAPMYKRMAAFQGDTIFQAPRRFFLEQRSSKQPTWVFISQRGSYGGLGYPHGSDFGPALLGPDEVTDYVIQFTATSNPNGGASNQTIHWPTYDTKSRKALSILEDGIKIGNDSLRLKPMEALTALSVAYPL